MSSIREVFVPHKGHNHIVELDYSQLEVRVLAAMSNDKQLIDDINAGVDLHLLAYAQATCSNENQILRTYDQMFKVYKDRQHPHWDDVYTDRKLGKAIRFSGQYGAGLKKMAEIAGTTSSNIKRYKRNYAARYPRIDKYHKSNKRTVEDNSHQIEKVDTNGQLRKRGHLYTDWGRGWAFESSYSDYANDQSFSLPTIMNYPIQGTAADVMIVGLVNLRRVMHNHNLYEYLQLLNTVHDSVIMSAALDDKKSYEAVKLSRDALVQSGTSMERMYGFHFPVKLDVEVNVGPNWGETVPLDIDKVLENRSA